jgi:hypothetical protein
LCLKSGIISAEARRRRLVLSSLGASRRRHSARAAAAAAMSGLTVPPAAVLLAIYSAMLLYAIVLSVLLPPLRQTRVFLCVYLAIRLFSLAVWLSSALGNSLSTTLYNASFSLFYAGFFVLVGASYPLFYAWLAQVGAAACGVKTAPLVAVAKYSRLVSFAGVILLVVSGSQLATTSLGNTGVAWSGPVGVVGAGPQPSARARLEDLVERVEDDDEGRDGQRARALLASRR